MSHSFFVQFVFYIMKNIVIRLLILVVGFGVLFTKENLFQLHMLYYHLELQKEINYNC